MSIFFSVVVCTYNQSEMLKGCLGSLCQQTMDKGKYEIIVVDNNSTDDIRQVVEAFLDQVNLRYYLETRQGLSHARNRGYQEAVGQYVAYIDDDSLAAPDWLEVAKNIVDAIQPEPHCLGGPIHPFYTSPKPDWFEDKYEVRGFGNAPKFLKKDETLSGSNMIWNKDELNNIRGFDVNTGVVGNQLRMGDETNAFQNLWSLREQARIYYSPDINIYHWVPDSKMTVPYRLTRRFVMGQYAAYQMEAERVSRKLKSVATLLSKISKTSVRSLTNIRAYPHWQNWVVEDISPLAAYIGKLLGLAGIRPRISQRS